MTDLNLNNLKMDFKYIENSETAWNPNGVTGICLCKEHGR